MGNVKRDIICPLSLYACLCLEKDRDDCYLKPISVKLTLKISENLAQYKFKDTLYAVLSRIIFQVADILKVAVCSGRSKIERQFIPP